MVLLQQQERRKCPRHIRRTHTCCTALLNSVILMPRGVAAWQACLQTSGRWLARSRPLVQGLSQELSGRAAPSSCTHALGNRRIAEVGGSEGGPALTCSPVGFCPSALCPHPCAPRHHCAPPSTHVGPTRSSPLRETVPGSRPSSMLKGCSMQPVSGCIVKSC
jgi:hypothetical protein